jgi:hypothetical protein
MAGSGNNGFQCGILFARFCVEFGYKVVEACNGAIALKYFGCYGKGSSARGEFKFISPVTRLLMGSRYYPTLTTARIRTPCRHSTVLAGANEKETAP